MTDVLLPAALKILLIQVLMVVWAYFVDPYIYNLVVAIQWIFSMSIYKMIPYEGLQLIWDLLVLWSSYELFLWVFDLGGKHSLQVKS